MKPSERIIQKVSSTLGESDPISMLSGPTAETIKAILEYLDSHAQEHQTKEGLRSGVYSFTEKEIKLQEEVSHKGFNT